MSRYTVYIQCDDRIKAVQFIADNGRKMQRRDIVDRLNEYEHLAECVRAYMGSDYCGYKKASQAHRIFMYDALKALTPKTEQELLKDRLKAADKMMNSYGIVQYSAVVNEYIAAKAAHEAARGKS